MANNSFKIEIKASGDCDKLLKVIASLNYGTKEFNIESSRKIQKLRIVKFDNEAEAISNWIEVGENKMTAEMIRDFLAEKYGVDYEVKKIGAALKALGFVKVCKRIDGVPKHCYLVAIKETRLERFKKAQESGYEYLGVKAVEYENPDDFNKECERRLNLQKQSWDSKLYEIK